MCKTYANSLLASLLLGLVLSGCSHWQENYNVSNENRLILRLAETQCSNYPSAQAAQEFARLVEQKSGGRITIKVYDSGRLGDENSVVEQIQFGGIDLARVSLASLTKYSTKVQTATLPYMFKSPHYMWKALEGPFGEQIRESLRLEKITCLTWYEGGTKSFYNSKREVSRIEDLRGLKISVGQTPLNLGVYSDLGITPIPIPLNDVFMALKTGAIDGAEDNMMVYYTAKHYAAASYLMLDELSSMPEVIIGSRVTLMQLSKSDQAMLEQAAKESAILQRKIWVTMEHEARKVLTASGVRITEMDVSSKETISLAAKPYYRQYRLRGLDAPED